MTYKLPERKHLVHKPIEPRNLSKKLQSTLDVNAKGWAHQLKYDGCNVIIVVKDGKASAFSRTGEPVLSMPHVLSTLESIIKNDYVVFGEAYNFKKPHSDINGMFRRQSPQPDLQFVYFDGVPLADFEAGRCDIPYETRLRHLDDAYYVAYPEDVAVGGVFSPVSGSVEELESFAAHNRRHGLTLALDGYIARDLSAPWVAGAGKEGTIVKVKNHVSLDLKCVGIVEGLGKFAGKVGALEVEYKGKPITIGGGTLTDAERAIFFQNPQLIVGHIVEVHALGDSANGLLREPRFHRLRLDKKEADDAV